ncbi:ABC transporter permease [Ferribacterium limneticum]|uniref:ABC transporter permease n=1 Tax=Ferribacterium limneticum TaxID=76259 RepID=UPI0021F6454F|nr:ABC transporter permease [Ferribacterium limneticum]
MNGCQTSLLTFIVQGVLTVPIEDSVALFLAIAALDLVVATSMGIFMATLARNMPQFGLLAMLVLLPRRLLSGGVTPRESMPMLAQNVTEISPTTHFVAAAQAILYRGAGLDVLWL